MQAKSKASLPGVSNYEDRATPKKAELESEK